MKVKIKNSVKITFFLKLLINGKKNKDVHF